MNLPRATRGKTWEEIYGPEYAEIKRQQVRQTMGGRTLSFEQAMEDADVWDMGNAVTLCLPCHRLIPVGPYWNFK